MRHYQQTIHFPYQNAYLGVFMNDFDQPGDFYFPRSVRFHINKMGQKKYQRIHLGRDNLIKGDEIDILLDNGIELTVRRDFKKSMSKKQYEHLKTQDNFSDIRELVRLYTAGVRNMETLPEDVQNIVKELFDGYFPPEQQIIPVAASQFTTTSITALNGFITDLQNLPNWSFLAEDMPESHSFSELDLATIPWIRRRDRKFVPEKIEINGHEFVTSETRTYLFENSIAIKLKRIFEQAISIEDYRDFKIRRNKTLEYRNQNTSQDLFAEQALDLLDCTKEYQFFPLFLIDPSYGFQSPYVRSFPYLTAGTMAMLHEDFFHNSYDSVADRVSKTLSERFKKEAVGRSMQYVSSNSTEISLAMNEIRQLPPHMLAIELGQFYKIANYSRLSGEEIHRLMERSYV